MFSHFKVFDVDRESVPMFIYDLTDLTRNVLLTDRLLFTVCVDNDQVTVTYFAVLVIASTTFICISLPAFINYH